MILVDSSVWIDVLRDSVGDRVRRFHAAVDSRDIVFSRLTSMELLQGARDEREWELLSDYLAAQDYLKPTPDVWGGAARIYFELRRAGVTIRSPIDCCLAEEALRNEALLLHRDRDFERIAAIRPLQQAWLAW